jgi:glutathione reductase (NADPH)
VLVDTYSKTNIDSVYAVGDVTERAQLTPVAIREGAAFAETVFNNTPQSVDHSLIPTAVFSQPPIGTIGMSEAEANAAGLDFDVYATDFRTLKDTLSGSAEKTLMKLLVEKGSDKIIGLHIVGPDSGEMIQAFGVAVTMGATKAQFDATIAVHPTAAEELVTFKQPRLAS